MSIQLMTAVWGVLPLAEAKRRMRPIHPAILPRVASGNIEHLRPLNQTDGLHQYISDGAPFAIVAAAYRLFQKARKRR